MRRIIISVLVGLLALTMSATNPGMREYQEWSKQRMIEQAHDPLTKQLYSWLTQIWVEHNTKSHDLWLFTVFNTKTPEGKTLTVIGVFSRFLPVRYN